MKHYRKIGLTGICLLATQLACLWDTDTLVSERAAFPGVHEIIVGNFPRHSDVYYRWRLTDRMAIATDDRTPDVYDDIAVAHEKLGQHDQAIQVIREKIQQWPEKGRYESEANLGTFLIHAGKYEEAILHIEAALAINPDAHFGREKYQLWLVEKLVDSKDPTQRPFWSSQSGVANAKAYFQSREPELWEHDSKTAHERSVEGISGMLRFGNHNSALLLETLGDLLIGKPEEFVRDNPDAKQLAARAFLMASYQVEGDSRSAYRKLTEEAASMQFEQTIDKIETELRGELIAAETLQDQIAIDEAQWIAEQVDVDAAFQAKYQKPFVVQVSVQNHLNPFVRWLWIGVTVVLLIVAITMYLIKAKRNRLRQIA